MIRILALWLALAASAAWAHGLTVFASVDGADLVVESRFSTGKRPVEGTVRFYDGTDALIATHALGSDGTLRLPLADIETGSGLRIEVDTGHGHSDYWILTPEDIARQTAETGG